MTLRKEYKAIIFCGTLIIILLLIKGDRQNYAQWIFIPTLSIFVLFYFLRVLNISGKFKRTDRNIWNRHAKQDFEKLSTQDGIFSYDSHSFSFPFFDLMKKYKWTDIKTLVAYKEDCMTYDEIYLRILFNDRQLFLISEQTPGWFKFNDLLKTNIPSINNHWDFDITQPAFAHNLTVIFDKENRDPKIAINDSFDETQQPTKVLENTGDRISP